MHELSTAPPCVHVRPFAAASLVKTPTTTTASADFCSVTPPITQGRAPTPRCASLPSSLAKGGQPPPRLGLVQPADPSGSSRITTSALAPSRSPRIRTCAFVAQPPHLPCPLNPRLRRVVPARPQTEPSMRFVFLGSQLCTWASFRQALAALPLPSASGYPDRIEFSHSGLSPHKLMPMSGVPRGSSGRLASGACQCASAFGLRPPLSHNVDGQIPRRLCPKRAIQ